jgi:ERCC4-type nuclease
MHPVEVKRQLDSLVCLVDTREQDTIRAKKRLESIGLPIERVALNFGDYSARCGAIDLSDKVVIERKMDLTELCGCYCKDRPRFEREFLRAKNADAKVYLLIENGSWEKAYNGVYRSQMRPESLVASMTAWLARYRCQLIFCKEETSGKLIHDILYREMKERLEELSDECSC